MRTFVLNDRGRYKFWDVELHGRGVTISQGQVGRPAGRSEKRSFDRAEQAREELDRVNKDKTGKGYVETTVPAQPTLPPAASLRDTLERAILDDPSDLAAHAAYADWLSDRSSPADLARAELIRIQLSLEDEPLTGDEREIRLARAQVLLEQHQRDWAAPTRSLALGVVRRFGKSPQGRCRYSSSPPGPESGWAWWWRLLWEPAAGSASAYSMSPASAFFESSAPTRPATNTAR